jgi:hypothetical protein
VLPLNLRDLLPAEVGTTLAGVSHQETRLRTAKRRLLLAMKEPRRRVSTHCTYLVDYVYHDTFWPQRTARVVVVEEEGVVVIAVEGVVVLLTDIARQAKRSYFCS